MNRDFNILPIILGTDYFVLAEQSDLFIPPLSATGNTISMPAFSLGMKLETTGNQESVPATNINLSLAIGFGGVSGLYIEPFNLELEISQSNVEQIVPLPELSIGLNVDIGDAGLVQYVTMEQLSMGLSANPGNVSQDVAVSPLEIGLGSGASPLISIPLQPFEIGLAMDMDGVSSFETGSAIVRYFCILTGTADGTTDLTLPMASFQARRRSGDPTYLSVVIPTVDYADEIAARPNGTLKIQQAYEQNGVIKQTETIMETTLDEVNPDEGGTNQSTTLTGYSTSTYSVKAVTLTGVTYRSTRAGKYHYRLARPYIFLNPGDTVTFSDDGVSFVIDTMSYFINPTTSTIELAST